MPCLLGAAQPNAIPHRTCRAVKGELHPQGGGLAARLVNVHAGDRGAGQHLPGVGGSRVIMPSLQASCGARISITDSLQLAAKGALGTQT